MPRWRFSRRTQIVSTPMPGPAESRELAERRRRVERDALGHLAWALAQYERAIDACEIAIAAGSMSASAHDDVDTAYSAVQSAREVAAQAWRRCEQRETLGCRAREVGDRREALDAAQAASLPSPSRGPVGGPGTRACHVCGHPQPGARCLSCGTLSSLRDKALPGPGSSQKAPSVRSVYAPAQLFTPAVRDRPRAHRLSQQHPVGVASARTRKPRRLRSRYRATASAPPRARAQCAPRRHTGGAAMDRPLKRRPRSEVDIDALCQRWNAGETLAEIATWLGRTPMATSRLIDRLRADGSTRLYPGVPCSPTRSGVAGPKSVTSRTPDSTGGTSPRGRVYTRGGHAGSAVVAGARAQRHGPELG